MLKYIAQLKCIISQANQKQKLYENFINRHIHGIILVLRSYQNQRRKDDRRIKKRLHCK